MSSTQISVSDKVSNVNLHLMPFTIVPQNGAQSQEARVSDFFLVKEHEGALKASFRGRDGRGVRLDVPEGYVGMIVSGESVAKKYKVDDSDEESGDGDGKKDEKEVRQLKKVGEFNHFILWDHDVAPHPTDHPFEWMRWPQVAEVLHKPIDASQVEAKNVK